MRSAANFPGSRSVLLATSLAGLLVAACGGNTPATGTTTTSSGSDSGTTEVGGGAAVTIDIATLGDPCDEASACSAGLTCQTYSGFAGPDGPEFKSCELACSPQSKGDFCPSGSACVTIADGPGSVCRVVPAE